MRNALIRASEVFGLRQVLNTDTPLDYAYTIDPLLMTATSPNAINRTVYIRLTKGAKQVSSVRLYVGTQSGNISVAYYTNTGTSYTAKPNTRVATSGAVACPAAGEQNISLGTTLDMHAGDWLAISTDNATATFGACAGPASAAIAGRYWFQDTAHPAPATAAVTAVSGRPYVLLGIQ